MYFVSDLRLKAARDRAWLVGNPVWMRQWLLDQVKRSTSNAFEFKSGYAARCLNMASRFRRAPDIKVGNPRWEEQPRVSPGSPEGGEWTRLAGDVPDGELPAKSRNQVRGHHYIPRSVYGKIKGLSDAAMQIFETATTGRLHYEGNNLWDTAHRIYRDAVYDQLNAFIAREKIAPELMTGEQARQFLTEVQNSSDRRVGGFNRTMKLREILHNVRQRGLFRGQE